ncbi:hypothetical protein AB0C38_24780 [Amycolatopsis sp. NPDC048633]|uniref:hypothetical protein n=1 Tax=Amycolatopsis sp. NPDC048633 TaxID=3157095 RepID=UPI0033C78DCB
MTACLRAGLRVAEAASLARSGDLAAAAAVLADAEAAEHARPAELDLLARIHAQRGDFEKADLCWARIQATDPEHAGAADGRALIAAIRARRRRARPLLRPVAGLIVVASLLVATASGSDGPARSTPPEDVSGCDGSAPR